MAEDEVGSERIEHISTCETSGHEHGCAVARPVAERGHLFTRAEWDSLCALRTCYQQDPDLLSERERGHVCFLRWLYQTGRLEP
jgi:hypothetical protein